MGEAMENRQLFYVGSFAQHINVIEFDRLTENISLVNRILGEPQPAHMQISSDGTLLYCANEYMEGTGGVSVYRLDDPKAPEQISFWASDTEGPAYISIAEDGRWLLGAGYFDGRVQAWPIDPDGGVRRCECTIQHVGDGPFALVLGCVAPAMAEFKEPEWPTIDEEITLLLWCWAPNTEGMIAAFNEVYPNIHIEHPLTGGGNMMRLGLMAAAKLESLYILSSR